MAAPAVVGRTNPEVYRSKLDRKSSSADVKKRATTVATDVRCSSADSASRKSRAETAKMIGADALAEKPDQESEVDFFDWLMDQSWVKRVTSSRGHTKISTKYNTTTGEAEQKLRDGGFGAMCPTCTFVEAVEAKFEFAANGNDDCVPSPQNVEIKSGDKIGTLSNIARFGGAIRLPSGAGNFGLSVAHIFNGTVDGRIFQWIGGKLGPCIGQRKLAKVGPIYMEPSRKRRKITVDICFLQTATNVLSFNKVVLSGKSYSLKLYDGDIKRDTQVIIFIEPGVIREGQIHDEHFCDTVEEKKDMSLNKIVLHEMMTIIAKDGSLQKVTEVGDCGSLVMMKQDEDDENMHVIGIVSGGSTENDGTSFTVANRLMDVLQAIGQNEDLCLTLTDMKFKYIDLCCTEFLPLGV